MQQHAAAMLVGEAEGRHHCSAAAGKAEVAGEAGEAEGASHHQVASCFNGLGTTCVKQHALQACRASAGCVH
eukprot:scaffold158089_cov18-Tisochrysis_lutea.AAC.2